MTICPTCKKEAHDPPVMRDWIWVRRGNDGEWFCCWECLRAYSVDMAIKEEDEAE